MQTLKQILKQLISRYSHIFLSSGRYRAPRLNFALTGVVNLCPRLYPNRITLPHASFFLATPPAVPPLTPRVCFKSCSAINCPEALPGSLISPGGLSFSSLFSQGRIFLRCLRDRNNSTLLLLLFAPPLPATHSRLKYILRL